MWHEARKQEKIVRKVIVDYRRRAERKHDYYDKIKQDPTKFMQVHGKRMKLIIDENITFNDNSSHMVPWQGDKSNMIDRFDVRAHLDFIKDLPKSQQKESTVSKEEKKLNYERYRILVYNEHKGISESQHLHKIFINETYPELTAQRQEAEAKKVLLQSSKATIGFDYGEGSCGKVEEEADEDDSDSSVEDDDEFLSDLEDIPPLRDLNPSALQDIEKHSLHFGMGYTDFVNALDQDQSMQLQMDAAKAIENEKLKMAGKKSRRERRTLKDQRLKDRVIGPLSYAQRDDSDKQSGSGSDSSDSDDDVQDRDNEGAIEFITSFGDNNGLDSAKPGQSAQPAVTTSTNEKSADKTVKKYSKKSRSRSRGRRSRSHDRYRRSRSRSRGYGRSRRDSDSSHRRDYASHRRRSGSRDRSYRRRSRSRSNERWSRAQRSRSRERRSRSRDRRSRSIDRRRSRSRERRMSRTRSRDRSPGKVATATLKSATPSKLPPATGAATKKLTPQEKLKIKMQRALKKQLKADKIAMADKRAQAYNEQMEREDDLREMARKMRRREHDKRDRYDRNSPHRNRGDYR